MPHDAFALALAQEAWRMLRGHAPWDTVERAARSQRPVHGTLLALDADGGRLRGPGGVLGHVPREELPWRANDRIGSVLSTLVTEADAVGATLVLSSRAYGVRTCERARERGGSVRGRVVSAGEDGMLLDVHGLRGWLPRAACAQREGSAVRPVGPPWAVPQRLRAPRTGSTVRAPVAQVTDHLVVLGAVERTPPATMTGSVVTVDDERAVIALDTPGAGRAVLPRQELSWRPVPSLAAVLRPGARVTGAAVGITVDGPVVSPRALVASPWPAIALELAAGTPVEGRVVSETERGTLVRLLDHPHAEALLRPTGLAAGARVAAVVERVEVGAARLVLGDVTPWAARPGPRRATAARRAGRPGPRPDGRGS